MHKSVKAPRTFGGGRFFWGVKKHLEIYPHWFDNGIVSLRHMQYNTSMCEYVYVVQRKRSNRKLPWHAVLKDDILPKV